MISDLEVVGKVGIGIPRAGASGTTNPTRRRVGPSFNCLSTVLAPMNPPCSRRALPMSPVRYMRLLQKATHVLTNNPAQASLYRGSRLIQVVSIQAHTRFEAQAVASPKASQLNGVCCKELSDIYSLLGWDGDLHQVGLVVGLNGRTAYLKTVFSSVSTTGDMTLNSSDVHISRTTKQE